MRLKLFYFLPSRYNTTQWRHNNDQVGSSRLSAPLNSVPRDGRLVALKLDAYEQGEYPLYAMRKAASPPGPAGQWLIDAFQRRLSTCPSHGDIVGMLGLDLPHEMQVAAE